MIPTVTSLRRAKNRRERAQGKRWIAAKEFPGGRKITLLRSRTRPPAKRRVELNTVQDVNSLANAGVIDITTNGSTPVSGRRNVISNRPMLE